MRFSLHAIPKDYLASALMVLIGVGATVKGTSYNLGSLQRMGPGYFPVALGVLLSLIGIAIGVVEWLRRKPVEAGSAQKAAAHPPEWRGWICILGSTIAFIVLGHHAGFIAATLALVFISALGDRDNSLKDAFLLSIAMVVICVVVFSWALKMTFHLFPWG